MHPEIAALPDYISQHTKNMKYGSVSITIKVHSGEIRFIERSVTESRQLEPKQVAK